jgi:diguanylate cyclase (GGDEF)-like protein
VAVRAARTARPWWRWHLGAVGSVVVVTPMLPWFTVKVIVQLLCSTTVIVAIIAGIRLNRPRHRLGWRVLLVAVTVTVVSNVAWPVLQAAGVIGISPAVDLLYYLTYPVLGLALFLLPLHGRTGSSFAGMTETGIITSGAVVLWWTLLVDPLVLDAGRVPDRIHLVAYPLLDTVIFALGLRLLLVGGADSIAYLLVAASTASLVVADTALSVAPIGGGEPPVVSVVCWLLANAMLGAAALHPSMARERPVVPEGAERDKVGGTRVYIAAVVLTPIVTGIFLVHERWRDELGIADIVVPVGATALTAALVVIRMRQLNELTRRHAIALEQSLLSEADLQQELRHLAQHDPLTGLANRAPLFGRITSALARDRPGALLVLDIDNFKEVNDRFGHAAGDDLLVAASERLAELITDGDLLARLDSDEFAVMVENGDAAALAGEVLAGMRRPFQIQGHELFATVSVGLRQLEPDQLTGDVLRDAYMALHAAKASGRDQLTSFDRELSERKLAAARTVERLRGAIVRGELLLYYQPLVRLADERMVGVEALLRWQPAGERMVQPDQFIPAAEDSGLIVPIGAWVLREACRTAAEWHRLNGAVVSVNVSPRQLREPDFGAQVRDALRSSALPPSALILEITEGVLVDAGTVTEQAIGHLSMLRELGVRVAIDDFGTGYSSLAYLRTLPIDHIKIDKSFMPAPGEPDPTAQTAARTIVKAVIDLASGLNLSTIAEGVETAEQVALLRALGCEKAQGYFFARPLPAAEAGELLAASVSRTPV